MAKRKLRKGPHKAQDLFDMVEYPELSKVWGIYVGEGCVTGNDPLDWKIIEAHAHALQDDEWKGWICIADPGAVITATGRPSHTLIHEVAHLILQNASHNKKWHDTVVGLGATVEAKKYYRSRVKKEKSNVIHEESSNGNDC